jgi:hypothetical protein
MTKQNRYYLERKSLTAIRVIAHVLHLRFPTPGDRCILRHFFKRFAHPEFLRSRQVATT